MKVTAKVKYLRIAPRKVRLVADLVRGKKAEEARTILDFTTNKAAKPLLKLLNSALASAKNSFQLETGTLYVSQISVDEGPKFKRWMARARGQASEIQKKTSHVNLVLEEVKGTGRPKKKKTPPKASAQKAAETPEETERALKTKKPPRKDKPPAGRAKFRPVKETLRPKQAEGIKKIFRRKAV